jgi:GAF domain-containing protein
MSGNELSGEDEVLDLVGAIYDAALDATRWPDILNRIGDAVGGPEVIFGVYDPTTGLSNLLAPRIDPALVASLMEWAPRNPLLPLGAGQAPGKVFTAGDFITRDAFTATDFYNEWWLPAGYDTEPLTTNLLVDHGATGIFTSHGSLRRSPFDSVQKRMFAKLAQHLVRAVALQRRLYHLTFASDSALAGFDDLRQGFFLVDAQARPVFINRVGRALLDARDGLRLEAGGLSAANADDGTALRALIASCAIESSLTNRRRNRGAAANRTVAAQCSRHAGTPGHGCRGNPLDGYAAPGRERTDPRSRNRVALAHRGLARTLRSHAGGGDLRARDRQGRRPAGHRGPAWHFRGHGAQSFVQDFRQDRRHPAGRTGAAVAAEVKRCQVNDQLTLTCV